MWRCVGLVLTDVPEERISSIFRVEIFIATAVKASNLTFSSLHGVISEDSNLFSLPHGNPTLTENIRLGRRPGRGQQDNIKMKLIKMAGMCEYRLY
jgi:hypothetical protein